MSIVKFLLPLTFVSAIIAGPEAKAKNKANKIAATVKWQGEQAKLLNMSLEKWQKLHGKRSLKTDDIVKSDRFTKFAGVYENPFKLKKVQFVCTELINQLKAEAQETCEQLQDDLVADIIAKEISTLNLG